MALVAHTNLTQTGTFHSSSDLLNKIQQASLNSLSNNMHGLQSNTPTYEKNGWTGDAQASSLAAILNFDVARFWSKWMNDVQDSQSDRGEIPEIVPSTPFYGYENTPGWDQTWGPTPSWDAMAIILPDEMYRHYGDTRILENIYPTQKRLVDYTATYINSANGFTYNHNLGEYAAAEPPMSTMPVIPANADGSPRTTAEMISYFMTHRPVTAAGTVDATAVAYFYLMLTKVAETETLLGKASESARHREPAEDVKPPITLVIGIPCASGTVLSMRMVTSANIRRHRMCCRLHLAWCRGQAPQGWSLRSTTISLPEATTSVAASTRAATSYRC